jgi:hypothetical protein
MALTKVTGSGVEGITNLSNATFLSVDASEVATLLTSAVINSEGGAVTTNIAQGLAKCWIHLKGADTFANVDSLNVSGVTDNGTGDYTITINNDMGSNTYSVTGLSKQDSGAAGQNMRIDDDGTQTNTMAAGLVRVNTTDGGNSAFADSNIVCATIHGDLA